MSHEYSGRALAYEVGEASKEMAMGEICESQHLAAKKGAVQKLLEARWRDQTQRSVGHTRSPGGAEHAISKVPAEGVHAKFRGR